MLKPMHKHRSAAGVTILHGEVVACGGHDGLSIFDSVSKLYYICGGLGKARNCCKVIL